MRNERGGILSRLVLLAFIVCGVWLFYTRWWPQNNLQHLDGRLENSIDKELTRLGVTDKDILSQVRKEHGDGILKWVETQRTIRVQDARRAEEIAQGLDHAAQRVGCSLDKTQSDDALNVQIKRFFWVMQRFTLVTPSAGQTAPAPAQGPQVAFVIDDVATDFRPMDHFASLGVPLTFAILPRDRHCRELAEKAGRLNFPVILHLPMEPIDLAHNDPGSAGLYLKMSNEQLKSQFEKDVASVPNIVGINNHMGSAFTENDAKMTLVMNWVKKKNIFFLDSHTTPHSVVCKAAGRVGVPCLVNETFLDNEDSAASIEHQLDIVLNLAVKRGQTIAIGHYRRKHLIEALANRLPEFKARGVQIVTLPTFYHQ